MGGYFLSLGAMLLVPLACSDRLEAAQHSEQLHVDQVYKIETSEVFGVHLGMSISEARDLLIAQGFSRSDYNRHTTHRGGPGFFWEANYRRNETNDDIEIAYTKNRLGVPTVSLIYATESFGDVTRAQALIRVSERYGPPTQTVSHIRHNDYWWTGASKSIDDQQFYDSMTCFDHRRCANIGSPPDMCRADKVLKYPVMTIGFNTNKPRDLVAYITIADFSAPHDLLFDRAGQKVIHRPEICPPAMP